MDILTFRIITNINKKLSLQGYLELFSNQDIYFQDSYSEYFVGKKNYDSNTPYIKGTGKWLNKPVYTTNVTLLDSSYLDPNLFLGLFPFMILYQLTFDTFIIGQICFFGILSRIENILGYTFVFLRFIIPFILFLGTFIFLVFFR